MPALRVLLRAQKTAVPAFSQVVEQCIRIFSVLLIVHVCRTNRIPITVLLAVWGLLIGEAASAVFCLLVYGCSKPAATLPNANTPITPLLLPLLTMALPLMANRLTLSFLQSLEAIFVPNQLLLSGLSRVESVSIYGVLTGMALPFILFPSAITNSLAVVLLPAVSEAQAQNQPDKIERTISMALRYSLYMGILCVGLFTRFGPALGETFYHNADAGRFIQILSWLCPFLYLSTTMGSILNGLGKTGTVFIHHTVSMLLTLSLVLFAIPRWGIFAYLAALLISELVLAFLHIHALAREVPIPSASQPGDCKTGILPAGFDWGVRSYFKRVLPASPVSACPHPVRYSLPAVYRRTASLTYRYSQTINYMLFCYIP